VILPLDSSHSPEGARALPARPSSVPTAAFGLASVCGRLLTHQSALGKKASPTGSAHCDKEILLHMCCTMCIFFAIFLNYVSGLTSHTRIAGQTTSSRHPKTVSGNGSLRTWCRKLTKFRENQNMLLHKDFQKHFFLSQLCKSDLGFPKDVPENGNDFNTQTRRARRLQGKGFRFLVPPAGALGCVRGSRLKTSVAQDSRPRTAFRGAERAGRRRSETLSGHQTQPLARRTNWGDNSHPGFGFRDWGFGNPVSGF
jgi:hypothetical protein